MSRNLITSERPIPPNCGPAWAKRHNKFAGLSIRVFRSPNAVMSTVTGAFHLRLCLAHLALTVRQTPLDFSSAVGIPLVRFRRCGAMSSVPEDEGVSAEPALCKSHA